MAVRPRRRHWFLVIMLILAVYAVLPQLGSFKHSFSLLAKADVAGLGLAAVMIGLTYLAGAGTYCLLAKKSLFYGRTVLVQFASTFANRLLPAGIGNLGVNYQYLRASKHSQAQAVSVLAANNSLGFIGHALLATSLLAMFHNNLPGFHLAKLSGRAGWLLAGLVIVVAAALAGLRSLRRKLEAGVLGVFKQLGQYRHQPLRLLAALTTSITLTFLNVAALWFCVTALHAHLSFVGVLFILTFGIAIGTATPTPGGLGGVEAGLLAGLLAYHLSHPQALAIVLAYRLIYYWLALMIGAVALFYVERRGYI